MNRILVTGAMGQIGSELAQMLCKYYGTENIILTDIRFDTCPPELQECQRLHLDVSETGDLAMIVRHHQIKRIYHLAALLSATAEQNPQKAWMVNINGLYNVLEVAREFRCSVFTPSSIGAFGPTAPKEHTPQDTIQRPTTMYGVTKVAGELLCDYYFNKYGLDTRGLRYPGIISWKTPPGGGTTDYAVEIYYKALQEQRYTCFLKEGTRLDMMYMPDALRAAVQLMEADPARLKHRNAFNVSAMSVTPEDFATAIRKHVPEFKVSYQMDPVRQSIADSWPDSLDDSAARQEWGWRPEYDLERMTADMLANLKMKFQQK
jgi:nucleoside-diphosphate-sugar epimerase